MIAKRYTFYIILHENFGNYFANPMRIYQLRQKEHDT